MFLPLVIEWDNKRSILWLIDASLDVHKDMCSDRETVITLGESALLSFSLKQKITTKNSTELEIVAIDVTINLLSECSY